MLRIELSKEKTLVIITLSGKFDITEVHNFEKVFMDQLNHDLSLIALNLKDLVYIDSSGIGSFVRCMNMAVKDDTDFLCFAVNKNIKEIFKLARLDQFIKLLSEKEFNEQYGKK